MIIRLTRPERLARLTAEQRAQKRIDAIGLRELRAELPGCRVRHALTVKVVRRG